MEPLKLWIYHHSGVIGVFLGLAVMTTGYVVDDRKKVEQIAAFFFAFLLGIGVTLGYEDFMHKEWENRTGALLSRICPAPPGTKEGAKQDDTTIKLDAPAEKVLEKSKVLAPLSRPEQSVTPQKPQP